MIASPKSSGKPPPIKDSKSANSCDATPAHLKKVGLSFRNWSDSKILWNSLPPAICNLGKVGEFVIVKDLIFTVCSDVSTYCDFFFQDVRTYRNASFLSAVHAMEEASASEGVIRCMR